MKNIFKVLWYSYRHTDTKETKIWRGKERNNTQKKIKEIETNKQANEQGRGKQRERERERHTHTHTHTHTQRERKADRQTKEQQTDRQTRQTDRMSHKQRRKRLVEEEKEIHIYVTIEEIRGEKLLETEMLQEKG